MGLASFLVLVWIGSGTDHAWWSPPSASTVPSLGEGVVSGVFVAAAGCTALVTWRRHAGAVAGWIVATGALVAAQALIVTLIALHLKRARREPTLVVCPASLLGNWQREITRFAPGVPVRRFHGPDRTLDDLDGGFVLTTYGTMRSAAPTLAEQRWGMVVADEAQHVKNPHSATAKALRTVMTALGGKGVRVDVVDTDEVR